MNKIPLEGGWYAECWPGGSFCALITGKHIATHLGNIPLPEGDNVLFLRGSDVSAFKMAGQSHGGRGTLEWTGANYWTNVSGSSYGVNPVIYDRTGLLHLGAPKYGAQGFRFVDEQGVVWTGDQTYADPSRVIGEWTQHGDVTVGFSGYTIVALYGGKRHILASGGRYGPNSVRFNRTGDALAITWHDEATLSATLLWCTVAELAQFPTELPPPPPPPPVDDPPVEEPPVSFTYDTGPLNAHAQARWAVLPHATRHEQAAALFRLLYEFNRPEVEVFRKGVGGTHFLGSDGFGYAEDICVIVQPNGKWWKDVGVAFGDPSARLDFGQGWQLTDQPQNCYPPPYPEGDIPPVDEPEDPQLPPDILARLAAMEDNARVQGMALQEIVAAHNLLAGRVTALENTPPVIVPTPLPDDVVRTSTHEVKTPLTWSGTLIGKLVKKG